MPTTDCAVQPQKSLLPRRVPMPDFAVIAPVRHVAEGRTERRAAVPNLWKDRSLVLCWWRSRASLGVSWRVMVSLPGLL